MGQHRELPVVVSASIPKSALPTASVLGVDTSPQNGCCTVTFGYCAGTAL